MGRFSLVILAMNLLKKLSPLFILPKPNLLNMSTGRTTYAAYDYYIVIIRFGITRTKGFNTNLHCYPIESIRNKIGQT